MSLRPTRTATMSRAPSSPLPRHATLWLLASAAAAMLSCSPRAPADLVVTSFSPGAHGQRAGTDVQSQAPESGQPPAIQVQFDRPVIADSQVGAPLAAAPVHIAPAVAVRAHWLDRQTLVLTPRNDDGGLRASTTYTVSLTGELAQRTGGFSFSFVHAPLTVEGVSGVDLTQLAPTPTLPIRFDQPVAPADVIARCRITPAGAGSLEHGADGAIRLALADQGQGPAAVVPVTPARALAQDQDYELICGGLTGAGGDTPMAAPFVLALRTHAPFAVTAAHPRGRDVPTDQVEIALRFATPVSLDAIRTHLRATPAIPGLAHGWLDHTGMLYTVAVDLETTTRYELSLDPALTDIHGQRADQAFAHTFTTGNARPSLSMETGIYAVEPASGGYPVWTRNVRDFDVTCAAVSRDRVVSLLTSSLDYDPWYDVGRNKALDWAALGLRTRRTRVAIDQVQDRWHLDRLALHRTCGDAGGQEGSGGKDDEGDDGRGLFLAEIEARDVQPDPQHPWRYRPFRRVLANVTDLGVLLKAGPSSGLVWVTSMATGKPVAGARVTLYTPQGRQVHRSRTDADGLLRIPGTTALLAQPEGMEGGELYSYRSQRMIALVERGRDLAVIDGNWANGIQIWNFGVPEDRAGGVTRIRGFIQSDRGIYRPGETVHFKGLVREIAQGRAPAVPGQRRIHVRVSDSRGQQLFDRKLPVSRFGGFAFALPLATEASLGDYYVSATIQDQTFRERFQVEEFRPVSFEVELDSAARHGLLGQALRFDVAARYLFGAPAAGADVTWHLQRRPHHVRFDRYAQYAFTDQAADGFSAYFYGYGDDYESLALVSDGAGKTDARGGFRIEARDSQGAQAVDAGGVGDTGGSSFEGPQDYLLSVTVRDPTDQAVTTRTVMTAHRSDFYLGLHTQEMVQAVGMPFAVNAVALTPTGERVATRATLRFIRQTYQCDYQGSYRVWRSCTPRHQVALERAIDIPRTGAATERILPDKPGEYIVRLEATDSRGNRVSSAGYIWVLGKGEAFWSGDESARMALVASKPRYQPGDTARLVPRTDMKDATALVTIERDGVLDAFVRPMATSAEGIAIPVTEAHAPNVFASVVMVAGRSGPGDRNRPQLKMGVTELAVASDVHRLQVTVHTERDTYQPGEQVSGTIRVRSAGAPVRAEVSLSAADEGVLQLIAYQTPNPMDAFYRSYGLGVDASTNWNRIARLNAPDGADPDEGGDSGGDPESRVRSSFVSSAYWAPSLLTDERGEVAFSFAAPDNLSAFRLMAVAADAGSRFGAGDHRITVSKPVLARPVLPRFLNTHDRAEVGVMVHNYTDRAGTAVVTARARGARLAQSEQRVQVPASGSVRVRFAAQPGQGGDDAQGTRTASNGEDMASFRFAVRMNGHSDAVEVKVPVHRPLRVDRHTLARGVLAGGGNRGSGGAGPDRVQLSLRGNGSAPGAWDADLVLERSELAITIDRTGLAALEPALRYLVQYPYGCLEQTLSRFIPLTKVQDLAASLDMRDLRGPELAAFIRAGVAKVVRHQHADGHFSLWPSGATYPHLTVYAIYGLSEARRAGVAVPGDAIDRGLAAIRGWVNGRQVTPDGDGATMAMAAYVLAELGQPDRALNARLHQGHRGLPRYGLAFLLRAMHRAGARRADIETVRDALIANPVDLRPGQSGMTGGAPFGEAGVLLRETADLGYYMSSDVRSSAMALSALLEVDHGNPLPGNPLIDRLAAGILASQRPGGGWRSTQDNIYSLVALADYARREGPGSATVTVRLDGKRLERRRIDGAGIMVLRWPLDAIAAGTLQIETSGKVRYAVRMTEARTDPGQAEDRGFTVERRYLDPRTGAPVTRVAAGDLVQVHLTVRSPARRRYVAVADPLPAGFEAVNTRLATSAQQASAPGQGGLQTSWGWTHTEIRDDRVLGFIDDMPAGNMSLVYLARATIPGAFTAGPARAEEMYVPEHYGRSEAKAVTVAAGAARRAGEETK